MSDEFSWPEQHPPNSEAEWEAAWDASIQEAREYGWPEEQIEAVLLSRRVSFAERVASLKLINALAAKGDWLQASARS